MELLAELPLRIGGLLVALGFTERAELFFRYVRGDDAPLLLCRHTRRRGFRFLL